MNLKDNLKVYTPLVWVVSDEPRRVLHEVIATETRPVFRMDVMEGLVTWDTKENIRKKVLVEVEPDQWVPTKNFSLGIERAVEERGVIVIENAHLMVEALVDFLGHVSNSYLDAFYIDDADQIPGSFILISCKEEIPPELIRSCVRVDYELPSKEEIAETLLHVDGATHKRLRKADLTPYVRAGLGMSEFEFAQATAQSLSTKGQIEHELINAIKLNNLKAGGLLEMRTPSIKMEDVGGLDLAKELMSRVAWSWNYPEESRKYGLEPLRRILLVGISGSGKSFLCEATANALGLELAKFGTSQMMSKWVGESESNMRKAFAQVKAMKPLVLWIDEFGRDMSGGQSSSSVDGGTTDRVHGEFLTGLQELPEEVFLVCAANRIDGLAPEMLRADRFDKIMFVGFPTEEERAEIFKVHLGEFWENYDLGELAEGTPFFTGAEIKALIKEVRFRVVGDNQRSPSTVDILAFAPKMKGRVWVNHQEAIVEMYTRAKKEWDWASSSQEAEANNVINAKNRPYTPKPVNAFSDAAGLK